VLLDTCVVSELQQPNGDPRVRRRVTELDSDDMYLSVITLGEVVEGISRLEDGRRKRELETWLLGLEQQFKARILSVDHEVARIWGELAARAQAHGAHVPAGDGLIAATAIRNGPHVMTRNPRDFTATGAFIVDPWQERHQSPRINRHHWLGSPLPASDGSAKG
jgi:predicted nucleic acid-binding protein